MRMQEGERQDLDARVPLDEVADGLADTSITSIARTMATIMTDTWFAIPTAVITESSENTMSSRRIWSRPKPNAARPLPPFTSWGCPSTFS